MLEDVVVVVFDNIVVVVVVVVVVFVVVIGFGVVRNTRIGNISHWSAEDENQNIICNVKKQQGRINGRTVADGLAGAVMPKTARNLKRLRDRPTYRPTDRHGKV